MTQIADDRSWWADVEHLRPGAVSTVAPPSTTTDAKPSAAAVIDPDAWREDPSAQPSRGRFAREEPDTATLRRARITGRAAAARDRDAHAAAPVLRRADAASFADAMDLDGAFASPSRGAAESREIVLTGSVAPAEEEWIEDQLWDEPGARRRPAPAADLWDDDGDLWEEPARRQPDPEQSVLWDDDDLWVQPARSRPGAAAAEARRGSTAGTRAQQPSRRTVVISASPAAPAPEAARRPLREMPAPRPRIQHPADRISYDPDRIAMWAVVLGILLVLIAASSSLT